MKKAGYQIEMSIIDYDDIHTNYDDTIGKGNLPCWIWPLISKSHAVFDLVPVATKQLALFIVKPATVYHG